MITAVFRNRPQREIGANSRKLDFLCVLRLAFASFVLKGFLFVEEDPENRKQREGLAKSAKKLGKAPGKLGLPGMRVRTGPQKISGDS